MSDGLILQRDLADGRALYVYPLTYGRARLGIGPLHASYFTDEW